MRQELPCVTDNQLESAVRVHQPAFGMSRIAAVAALAALLLQFSGCVIDGSQLITSHDTGSPLGGNVVMARPAALPTTIILGSKKSGSINLIFATPDDTAVSRLKLLFKTYDGSADPVDLGLEPKKSYYISITDFANGLGTISVNGATAKSFTMEKPLEDGDGPSNLNIYESRVSLRKVAICIEDQQLFGQLMIRSTDQP